MRTHRRALILAAAILLAALWPTGCDSDPAGPLNAPAGPSAAFGIWEPGPNDTCSKEIHDRYAVVGPDGKLYPTWHPPVDPVTGCSFGHEHGRDPRGSKLYREVGPIPFGYANEQLDIYAPHMRRHEDHVGHKIEWENDFELSFENGGNAVLRITCSVLTKLHQGSHSKDAFTNNLHELVYHIRCNDGTAMHITMMAAIGEPGVFHASCDRDRRIHAGDPTPLNSPRGGGKRVIPDRACVEQHMLVSAGNSNYRAALHESWETHNTIRTADGRTLATFDPYFQILYPSRYYDPTQPNNVGRPIDVCYEVAPNGARATLEGRFGEDRPPERLDFALSIDLGADLGFGTASSVFARFGASLGDRPALAFGLHAGPPPARSRPAAASCRFAQFVVIREHGLS